MPSLKNTQNLNEINSAKSSGKKYGIIILGILFICLVAGWFNRDLVVRYYHYSKIHHFSPGDKVFIPKKKVADTSFKAISIYRLIRPINKDDISKLNIDERKKSLLMENLKASSALDIVSSGNVLILDSLRKRNTTFIGTFVRKEFITRTTRKNEELTLLVYAIKLPASSIAEGYYNAETQPANYTYADNNLYLMYWDTSDN